MSQQKGLWRGLSLRQAVLWATAPVLMVMAGPASAEPWHIPAPVKESTARHVNDPKPYRFEFGQIVSDDPVRWGADQRAALEETVEQLIEEQRIPERLGLGPLVNFYETHKPDGLKLGWRKMQFEFYDDGKERLELFASSKDDVVMLRYRITLP